MASKEKKTDRSEESKFTKNYANTESGDRFLETVKGLLIETRLNRRQKETQWLEDHRQWACNLTDSMMYLGRANLFIPEFQHQVEATVSKYLSGMFPNLDYLGVRAINGTNEEIAEDIRAAVFDQIHYRNKAPVLFDRHARQRSLAGTSPLRARFVDKESKIFYRDGKNVGTKTVPLFRGVQWDLVDIFRWYICPEWGTMEDNFCIFEDEFIHKRDLQEASLYGKPMYVNLDQVNEVSADLDYHYWIDIQRLAANTIAQAATMRPHSMFVTTVWIDFDIEGDGNVCPCVGYIANNGTVIRLARNPYWDQKPPYVLGRYLQWPTNNFYGQSLADRLRSLCRWQTDTANQTMDSLTYALAPIAIIDPALAGDPTSFVMQPGARWLGSPSGIEFHQMADVTGTGWQAMQQIRSMIGQFSDQSTALAPQLTGKARSATQASFVNQEVSKDLRTEMMNEEFDVMIPMCHKTHSLLRQFQDKAFQILVQGPEKGQWIMKTIEPDQLEGEVDFEWYGQSIQEKDAVRNQQLMSFFQLATQSAQLPGMQGKVDFPQLFMRIAKEAFKLDHMEDFMVDIKNSLTVEPETENLALLEEMDVPVHMGDNDDEHMRIHSEAFDKAKNEEQKIQILRHNERHRQQKDAKAQQQKLEAQQQALQMALQQGKQQGGPSGGQGGGGPQGPVQGNVNQQPENPSEANLMRGVRGAEGNIT